MRFPICLLCIAFVAPALIAGPARAADYDVFILAGQSNMDGRGPTRDLVGPLAPWAGKQEAVLIDYAMAGLQSKPHTSGGWKTLEPGPFSVPPHKQHGPTFGPEIGFASVLSDALPGRHVALIKFCEGGTSLKKLWRPTDRGKLYDLMLAHVRAALKDLDDRGDHYRLRGFVWHQGESDVGLKASEYQALLAEFIEHVRTDLNAKDLPFVIGEVFDNGTRDEIRSAEKATARAVPNTYFVSSAGLTTLDGGTHFDAASQIELGKRLGGEMLKHMTDAASVDKPPAVTIEPNPGPGVDIYRSDKYRIELWNGSKWVDSYTYMTDNPNESDTWQGGAVHFTSFGANVQVSVRVTRLAAAIKSVSISPVSKHITATIADGKATIELKPFDKAWLTFDGDTKSSALLIFADPLKPAVPPGARYYKPGIHFAGDHGEATFAPRSNQTVYLDAGAWVKGNFDMSHCRGSRVIGPGVLSGELWNVTANQNPQMIHGGRDATATEAGEELPAVNSYDGFIVVRAPSYNFASVQADLVSNVKLISPWRHSTDGFQIIPHPDKTSIIEHCFAFVGDDVFFPRENCTGNIEIRNCFVASSNNSMCQICYWGGPLNHNHTMYAHDIDFKNYLNSDNSAVFRASIDNEQSTGVKNMTFENIRIEGDLKGSLLQIENRDYFWPKQTSRPESKMGNTYHFVFRNISLSGSQGRLSTLLGLNADNGHHDYLFDRVSINGTMLNSKNYAQYFDINQFAWNIRFAASASEAPVAVSTPAK
jgi:hypothetical protein